MLKTKALRVLKIFQNMIVALISLKIYEKATNRITHCEMIRRLYSYKSLLRFDSLHNGFDVYVFRFLVLYCLSLIAPFGNGPIKTALN